MRLIIFSDLILDRAVSIHRSYKNFAMKLGLRFSFPVTRFTDDSSGKCCNLASRLGFLRRGTTPIARTGIFAINPRTSRVLAIDLIFLPILLSVLTMGCTQTSIAPATVNLIERFPTSDCQAPFVEFDLLRPQDAVRFGKECILNKEGLQIPAGASELELRLDRLRDRIVALEFSGEIGAGLALSWAGQKLGINPFAAEEPGKNRLQFLLPSELQTIGFNRLSLENGGGSAPILRNIKLIEGLATESLAIVGGEIRSSLLLAPEVVVSYRLDVPQQAFLMFGLALDDRGLRQGSDGATCRIKLEVNKTESVIFERVLQPEGLNASNHWWEETISLEEYEGESVKLSIAVTAEPSGNSRGDVVAWSEPRVQSKQKPKTESRKPSVILITLDASRADRFGFNGDSVIKTPNLDRWAKEGSVFAHCQCQINNTPPSHFTILTSKRPRTHGVYDMVTPLDARHKTVAKLLQENGYRTGAAVSAAWLSALTHGLGPGFERYWAPLEAQRSGPDTFAALKSWLIERAENSTIEPFFLWLHMFDAHTPLDAPAPYNTMYYDGDPRDPHNRSLAQVGFSPEQEAYMKSWMKDITDLGYFLAQYRSEITIMDDVIGELQMILRKTSAADNTMIVVTADHGISLDEHDLYFIMAGMYEQQMNVPLLIQPPGSRLGAVYLETVRSLEIAPTILEYTGVAQPEDMEGTSLKGLMEGRSFESLPCVISEHANNQAVMVKLGDYKYVKYIREIYYHEPSAGLYDLAVDPQELVNLTGKQPEIEEKLMGVLDGFLQSGIGEAPIGAADSEQLREQLRSLGYLGE